jgi:alpha-glucosidase (family GH31 glycosyl hydrolase)
MLLKRTFAAVTAAIAAVAAPSAHADAPNLDAGALRAVAHADPWHLTFLDAHGNTVVDEASRGSGTAPDGAFGFRVGGVWFHATRLMSQQATADSFAATLATNDPAAGTIAIRARRVADGVIDVSADGPATADSMGIAFGRAPGERFLGFGERSDAVVRSSGSVENHVAEGPYQDAEEPFIAGFVPPAGYDPRHDATYFPIPWLVSSRGYGVLVTGNETSTFDLGSPWDVQIDGTQLGYRVYAGPKPADVVRRFSADLGRQPAAAAPFYFGPWWQAKGDPTENLRTLRAAGAIGSLVQTYTHYLPCGDQVGNSAAERARTQMFHAAGLAVTTYFNPMICTSYEPRFNQAMAARALTENEAGQPYEYRYTGASQFLVGQFDFSAPTATKFYGDLLDEAVQNGYDGWMEDFGEYTPPDSKSADGSPGTAMHNLYPTLYHGAAYAYSRDRSPRPLARFNRSGWTGAARVSQIVWGGDPSTTFGFDGLASAVRNGLSMGLSGVSLWGSDIGGYFSLSLPPTTPDLERRWIEVGFASGVMRTEADGYALQPGTRAQIFDKDVLPVWARYAKLRTRLYPYLAAAERAYDATGMPIMRQLALAYPDDPRAVGLDDEYLFGPDLLAAPVLTAAATSRRVYLPAGRWVDFWRSVDMKANGDVRLRKPVILDGGREVEVPAPADRLPLFVRAGAILPMLPADVQTLSDYGTGVVHLRDRAKRRTLLAWPAHGMPSSPTTPAADARVRSGMHGRSTWVLRVRERVRRRMDVQAVLPERPCSVTAAGRRVRFSYSDGVVRASVRIGSGAIVARSRCGSR